MNHPVNNVEWVPSENVISNSYNPNKVAKPEMELLKHSIESDGITQPIVVYQEGPIYEIVDGFHRSIVCRRMESLNGKLPIVVINPDRTDKKDRIASTIRHNRARGKHQISAMSDIVIELKRRNWTNNRISKELGMTQDEILRLLQVNGLIEMFSDCSFSEAWHYET